MLKLTVLKENKAGQNLTYQKDGDISSEEERKNASVRKSKSKNEPRNRQPNKSKIKIDRCDICPVNKEEHSYDAIFKGYKDEVVQDIIIKTENVKFKAKSIIPHPLINIIADSYRWRSSVQANLAPGYAH